MKISNIVKVQILVQLNDHIGPTIVLTANPKMAEKF